MPDREVRFAPTIPNPEKRHESSSHSPSLSLDFNEKQNAKALTLSLMRGKIHTSKRGPRQICNVRVRINMELELE